MKKRTALCLLLLPLFVVRLSAAQEPQAYAEDTGGIESSPEVSLLVTNAPAVKLGFSWRFTIPFLQGESPLTRGNNVAITPGVEISPVDVHLSVGAVWTPVAFLEVVAGGRVGSGWSVNLFGGDVHGIGLNIEDADGAGMHDGRAFDGTLWHAGLGAALQGDLSAFFPGEWNRVVFRSFHEINRSGYSRAGSGRAWFFENDDGENRNGFGYRGNLLIGYFMPLRLNMVALVAEAERFLTVLPGGSQWGDEMFRWSFSGVLGVTITERLEAALIAQLRTRRNYETPDPGELHFTNRVLDAGNRRSLEFHRFVLALTYSF